MLRLPQHPATLRVFQGASAIALVVTLALSLATPGREIRYNRDDCGHFISIDNASIQFGLNTMANADPPPGWQIQRSNNHPDWSLAWRPFHVQVSGRFWWVDYWVVPLWQLFFLATFVLAWSTARRTALADPGERTTLAGATLRRRLAPPRPRVLRIAGWSAAGACVLLFALSAWSIRHEAGCIFTQRGLSVALGDACLRIGSTFVPQYPEQRGPGYGVGTYSYAAYHADWALAWRPFHATNGTLSWSPSSFLVIPFAPLLALGVAVAAAAHGRLSALNVIAKDQCRRCGYELRGLPRKDNLRTCPECGDTRAAPAI